MPQTVSGEARRAAGASGWTGQADGGASRTDSAEAGVGQKKTQLSKLRRVDLTIEQVISGIKITKTTGITVLQFLNRPLFCFYKCVK